MIRKRVSCGAAVLLLAAPLLLPIGCAVTPRRQPGAEQLAQAQSLADQGLTDEALAAFTAVLSENPRLLQAHMGIGAIHRERGDYDQASKSYEQATALAPTSFDAHYYLALMNQLLGRLERAAKAYLQALTINPTSFDANQNLASTYLQMGRPAEALPYAKAATELNPSSRGAWANLAATYSLMARYADAVEAYRTAADLGDLEEPIVLGLADAHIRLGNFDRATNTLQTIIRLRPSATAYERLGYTQYKQRRYDDALASYRAALSLDSDDTAALNGLGVSLMTLYIQAGRVVDSQRQEALAAWSRSVNVNANQPKILDLIARYQR